MDMRVEELAKRASLSVDTVRYYQSKGLLDPPRRQGRIAWYSDDHLARLERIRSLQLRGLTLATIDRILSGELDAADEALLSQLSDAGLGRHRPTAQPGSATDRDSRSGRNGDSGGDMATYTLAQLAEKTGLPLPLLEALERDGLLRPRRVRGDQCYTDEDVAAAEAGRRLLEWGIPLPDLIDLARLHASATEAVARQAVELFARHVREPLRLGARPAALGDSGQPAQESDAVEALLRAYAELLPAVDTLVGHHFVRTLVAAAFDHVEHTGSDEERRAVRAQLDRGGHPLDPQWRRTPQSESSLSTHSLESERSPAP